MRGGVPGPIAVGESTDGIHRLTLDAGAYRLAAVKKAAYRLADRCTVLILPPASGERHELEVRFKSSTLDADRQETLRLLFEELLDQELREQIAEETAPIRTLILAHAFSKVDLVKRDE